MKTLSLLLLSTLLPLTCAARHPIYGNYVHSGYVGYQLNIQPNGVCTWSVTGCLSEEATECTWVENDKRLLILQKNKKQDDTSGIKMSINMIAKIKKNKVIITTAYQKGKIVLRREQPNGVAVLK